MTTEEFLHYMNSGKQVPAECDIHQMMHRLSQEAIRITMELNTRYHTPDEINALMSELIGKPVEVGLFPPFYTDCGKNIHLGKGVFINAGCKFQDQGGIIIDEGALIGHGVVLATLNHDMDPEKRQALHPAPGTDDLRVGDAGSIQHAGFLHLRFAHIHSSCPVARIAQIYCACKGEQNNYFVLFCVFSVPNPDAD